MQGAPDSAKFNVSIIGAGILGVSISYWLSSMFDCKIALIDKEAHVATHTSKRNTGVIHRPFYLNPENKRVFAGAAQRSYFMWKDLAEKYTLTWKPVGTLEVAIEKDQLPTLDHYKEWAAKNGMSEDEFEGLDSEGVKKLEPEVKCAGAIHSKTDTCVNYAEFTNFVFERARKNGVTFLENFRVKSISEQNVLTATDGRKVKSNFIINAAGGGAVEIAHKFDLAKEYTDLHFRGEYWKVEEPFASKISRNVYSVPKYKEFPFLDPHYIVRASGVREIGPNAVLVFGENAYKGVSESKSQVLSKIFGRPMMPKVKLFTSRTFLSLAWHEWQSSISKEKMCERVKQFIPSMDSSYLKERGLAGVRSSVIDKNGFVPEALLIDGNRSVHILNYNSPGASGAPAFSAHVVSKIMRKGHLDGLKKRDSGDRLWKFEDASDL